jgi:cyclopropane fatty-acyl-phospholipid synthase-like methyltransferase
MGFSVFGVDASPRLIAEFQRNCPEAQTECAGVEDSAFFGRQFQGVVAWGIVFLLTPEKQIALIAKVAEALESGGSFIFTAPGQACTWSDVLTGQVSTSLGAQKYGEVLGRDGLAVLEEDSDEGDNHYYFAKKRR